MGNYISGFFSTPRKESPLERLYDDLLRSVYSMLDVRTVSELVMVSSRFKNTLPWTTHFDYCEYADDDKDTVTAEQHILNVAHRSFQTLSLSCPALSAEKVLQLPMYRLKQLSIDLSGDFVNPITPATSTFRLPPSIIKLECASRNNNNTKFLINTLLATLPPYLQELTLEDIELTDDQCLHLVSRLPSTITKLTLTKSICSAESMNMLADHLPPRLTELHLDRLVPSSLFDAVLTYDKQSLHRLIRQLPPTLKILHLSAYNIWYKGYSLETMSRSNRINCNSIYDADTMRLLTSHLPSELEILALENLEIDNAGLEQLVCKLPKSLKELHLGGNKISDLSCFSNEVLPELHVVNINSHHNNNDSVGVVKMINCLPDSVHTLRVVGFGDSSADKKVTRLPKSMKLLNLSGSSWISRQVHSDDYAFFKHLEDTKIEQLYLHRIGVGAEFAIKLAMYLPSTLKILDLSLNLIGDYGLMALMNSELDMLEELQLECTNISCLGVNSVTESRIAHPKLKTINLQESSIYSDTLKKLLATLAPGGKVSVELPEDLPKDINSLRTVKNMIKDTVNGVRKVSVHYNNGSYSSSVSETF